VASLCSDMSVSKGSKVIISCNLCEALEVHDWSEVYAIKGADDVLTHIMAGIDVALDVVAPVKAITVKEGDPLYLAADTKAMMRLQDATAGRGVKHKRLRNNVMRMVRRDRVRSNVDKLAKSRGDPRMIWQIASNAMGQTSRQLPAALRVSAAEAVTPPLAPSSSPASASTSRSASSAARAATPLAAAKTPPAPASASRSASSAARAATPLAAAKTPPAPASSSVMQATTPLAAAAPTPTRTGDIMTVGNTEAATLMNAY
jgi:hypothetical protein